MRALGANNPIEIDIFEVDDEIEGIVLCSDGLTAMLNNTQIEKPRKNSEPVQLDIFTYQEIEETPKVEEINAFQISYIFESDKLPQLDAEKDILEFYKSLLNNKRLIVLPKLKTKKYGSYVYETNL